MKAIQCYEGNGEKPGRPARMAEASDSFIIFPVFTYGIYLIRQTPKACMMRAHINCDSAEDARELSREIKQRKPTLRQVTLTLPHIKTVQVPVHRNGQCGEDLLTRFTCLSDLR